MRKIFMKIKCKYEVLSIPLKASIWFVIANTFQQVISLFFTPIFTRLMSQNEYGMYSVYQSWASIISVFATLNLFGGVYNNGMIKWPDKRNEFTSSLQGLTTVLTIGLFLVYCFFYKFWNAIFELNTFLMIVMFVQLLFTPAYNFWSASERFEYKYKTLVFISLVISIIVPLVGVLCVYHSSYKAEAKILTMVIVQSIFYICIYINNFKKGKRFYHKEYWKYALLFNIPLVPHYLSQIVLNQADRIMIANFVGNDKAAMYSIAYTISWMFNIFLIAINNTFVPYTYKSLKAQNYNELKVYSSYLLVFVAGLCVIATAFGPEIIWLIASPEYYEARWVIPPVAAALFFMFLYPLFSNIEFYFETNKIIMIASLSAAIANVIMNYFAIKLWGYIAAAYTTLICFILLSLAHYVAYKRICKKMKLPTDIYNINLILGLSLTTIVFMFVLITIYDYRIVRYILIICVFFAFFAYRKKFLDIFIKMKG